MVIIIIKIMNLNYANKKNSYYIHISKHYKKLLDSWNVQHVDYATKEVKLRQKINTDTTLNFTRGSMRQNGWAWPNVQIRLVLVRWLRFIPPLINSDASRSTDQEHLVTKEMQRTECQHREKSDWLESPELVKLQEWGMILEFPKWAHQAETSVSAVFRGLKKKEKR